MDISGIISIAGKPGLYRIIAQSKGGVIVESIVDAKRFPASATSKISSLDDISMYTYEEDEPLLNIFKNIYEKENGGLCIDPKSSSEELSNYFREILPNYDEERIYKSDIKKLFTWYNLLQSKGILEKKEEVKA
jgi:hypothetical protein